MSVNKERRLATLSFIVAHPWGMYAVWHKTGGTAALHGALILCAASLVGIWYVDRRTRTAYPRLIAGAKPALQLGEHESTGQ